MAKRDLLINSTAEIEDLVPKTWKLNDSVFIPQSRSSQEFLYRFFPEKFIADIVDIGTIGIADEDVSNALLEIRRYLLISVSNHAIYYLLPKLYSSTTDAGVRTQDTQTHTRAPKWSYEELRKAYRTESIQSLEYALSTLDRNFVIISKELDYIKLKDRCFLSSYESIEKSMPVPIDILTYNDLRRRFMEMEEQYIYPVFPKNMCTDIKSKDNPTDEEKEFVKRASIVILVASLYHNLPYMSVAMEQGTIKGHIMADDETSIGQKVDGFQIEKLKSNIEQELNNHQGYMKKYLIDNADKFEDFDKTEFYISATASTSTISKFNNEESKSSFFF